MDIKKTYDIDFLVSRFTEKYEEKTDGLKAKNSIKGPDIQPMNRKIYIKNFADVCKSINRETEEVSRYVAIELKVQTSISIDGQLVIHGSYRKNEVQAIIVKYITNYVKCPACKSYNTIISKVQKVTYIKCDKCNASNAIS